MIYNFVYVYIIIVFCPPGIFCFLMLVFQGVEYFNQIKQKIFSMRLNLFPNTFQIRKLIFFRYKFLTVISKFEQLFSFLLLNKCLASCFQSLKKNNDLASKNKQYLLEQVSSSLIQDCNATLIRIIQSRGLRLKLAKGSTMN